MAPFTALQNLLHRIQNLLHRIMDTVKLKPTGSYNLVTMLTKPTKFHVWPGAGRKRHAMPIRTASTTAVPATSPPNSLNISTAKI